VLPGFQVAATSNIPITDERLDREFARVPTNYFEMTKENPELYEFMLAKLLKEEGNLPLIDKTDLAPYYQRVDLLENEREVLTDGSIKIAEDTLIENPADARHGFLYRFAGAIRAIQDSYIHGSQFNEKHMANTAIYEDIDDEGNIVVKGYVTDITDISQFPGGQMLKLKSGASTITAEIVSKWIEGFAQNGEKNLTVWLQQMVREHIDQTSPNDEERIKAIADYFHLFDEKLKEAHIKPLTPKEIGYLSPRVPRPLHVEKPKTTVLEEQSKPYTPREVKEYETRDTLLENGERILIKVRELALQEGLSVASGTKLRINNEEFVFIGVIDDTQSKNHGKPVVQLPGGEKLYKILSKDDIDWGIKEEWHYHVKKDLEYLAEDVENFVVSSPARSR